MPPVVMSEGPCSARARSFKARTGEHELLDGLKQRWRGLGADCSELQNDGFQCAGYHIAKHDEENAIARAGSTGRSAAIRRTCSEAAAQLHATLPGDGSSDILTREARTAVIDPSPSALSAVDGPPPFKSIFESTQKSSASAPSAADGPPAFRPWRTSRHPNQKRPTQHGGVDQRPPLAQQPCRPKHYQPDERRLDQQQSVDSQQQQQQQVELRLKGVSGPRSLYRSESAFPALFLESLDGDSAYKPSDHADVAGGIGGRQRLEESVGRTVSLEQSALEALAAPFKVPHTPPRGQKTRRFPTSRSESYTHNSSSSNLGSHSSSSTTTTTTGHGFSTPTVSRSISKYTPARGISARPSPVPPIVISPAVRASGDSSAKPRVSSPSLRPLVFSPPVSSPARGTSPFGPALVRETVSTVQLSARGDAGSYPGGVAGGRALGEEGDGAEEEEREFTRHVLGRPYAELEARYEVAEGELGRGKVGVLRACRCRATGRQFACKTISKAAMICEAECDEVRREVQMMQRARGHPRIVAMHEALEDARAVHVIMELCHGGELFHRIVTRQRYSEPAAASVARQLASALAFLHARGVAHRDVKPENILLCSRDDDTSIKLTDFGAATLLLPGAQCTERVGSPYYLAPEVLSEQYGLQADVWSAGVVLFVLLSGSPPFSGRSNDEIFQAVRCKEIDLTSKPWPSISEGAKDLVRRMLTRDPAARITMEEVLGERVGCIGWGGRNQA
ncbi:unnamed protein product [Closterium sp. Yama58-4]|nr:unnamed protein product [Closterium sp. Yama58-4]